MDNQLLLQLSRWISNRTGFYFPEKRYRDLERVINKISPELGFDNVESCARMLISSSLTKSQIDILIKHLTVGETYFFREKRSLEIFEKIVLTELINNCRAKGSRRLKIWSAGCSTGEEPYSIAIILKKLMPDLDSWDITIIGTDINEDSLQKASNGIYSEWSFRDTQKGFKERYFKKTIDNRFELQHNIKNMVTFSTLNLVETGFKHVSTNCQIPTDIDVIFCRNVLIYFSPKQIKAVVDNLHDCLAVGGYLIVSPSEMSNIFRHKFASVHFHGATFYKKDNKKQDVQFSGLDDPSLDLIEKPFIHNTLPISPFPIEDDTKTIHMTNTVIEPLVKINNISASTPVNKEKDERPIKTEEPEIKTNSNLYDNALDLFQQGRYDESVKLLLDIVANKQEDVKVISLLAQSYANKGELDHALKWSDKAISIDKMNPDCHYLNATILQEQGRAIEVVNALKRTLYLDNDFILAHFLMGNIFVRQGKLKQSDKHFKNALILLSSCEPGEILPYSDGMTAGRLMETIRAMKDVKINC